MVRNMDFNVATIIMLTFVFVYFILQYDIRSKTSRSYLQLVGCIILTAFLNIVCDFLLTIMPASRSLYLIYSVYLYFSGACAYILTKYTRVLVDPENKRKLSDRINQASIILYAISCIISVPFHYYVKLENKEVTPSGAYVVTYLLSGYYLIFAMSRIFKNIKTLSKRQTQNVIVFVVITFSGALLQFFLFGNQILIYFIYGISCLILLFAFETPDYQKMIKATRELEVSKQREDELTNTVHQLMKTSTWFIYFNNDGSVSDGSWSEDIKPLLGYSIDDDVDVTALWTESLHPDDKERSIAAFTNGLKGEEYRIETRLRYKDGSYHWFLCTGSLITDYEGNMTSYQGVIQNIDDEIYKRELINEKLKVMADLEKSKSDLQEALIAAEEASKAKTTFLSNMSHDIRTPMNAILGYAQLAMEHINDEKEVKESLTTIKSSGDHLLSLINDVLNMSRIESGKVTIESAPCNLDDVIREIEKLTKANVDQKKQTYETIVENLTHPYVMCDRLKLNQVLLNCIGNAVKYTPDGGHIKVSLTQKDSLENQSQKEYIFKITDNGMGMTKEFLEHIFEPFERAQDSTTSSIQGTGLGMAITENIVRMMGGKIDVESKLNEGSIFTITLPLTIISSEEYNYSVNPSESGVSKEDMIIALNNKKFLVVDDNKINRTVVKRLLEDRGMMVDECESGEDAVNIAASLKEGSYDMIFMDVKMPGMDGYEATDLIRKLDNDIAKNIPIIAMTANAFEEDKEMAKSHGMNGHVTKPFIIDELIVFLYENLIG